MSLIDATINVMATISQYLLKQLPMYCDLRTIVEIDERDTQLRPELKAPYILITEDNDYVSVFEIAGALKAFDDNNENERFNQYIEQLVIALTSEFKKSGHQFSFIFEKDPLSAKAELNNIYAPAYRSASRLNLALNDIIDEKIEKLAPYTAQERGWLVIYSSKILLASHEINDELADKEKSIKNCPPAKFGQNPLLRELAGLKIRHEALIDKMKADLEANGEGVLMRLLDAHEIGYELKKQVCRTSTHPTYKPLLASDKVIPHGIIGKKDNSPLFAPYLNFQLFDNDISIDKNKVVSDGMYHGVLSITLPPMQVQIFSKLINSVPKTLPFRVRFDLMTDGMSFLAKKRGSLSLLGLIPSFRPIYDSIEWLVKENEHNPVVAMSVMVTTWAETENELKRHMTMLKKQLEGWGVCEVTTTFGDIVQAWASTMLASSRNSGLNLLFPPLTDALKMLPLQRPATPWANDGNVIYQTEDGKIFPIRFGSSLQTKSTEIIIGEPGSGKSILANDLNLSAILQANENLPFLSIIDKGYSSLGLIDLVRDALPEHRKNEAIGITLKNSDKHCKNPFDVQLGASYPLWYEEVYLITLLTILCANPETGCPPNGDAARQILTSVVNQAYKNNADINPRRYETSLAPAIDESLDDILEKEGITLSKEDITWIEIRDLYFKRGFIALAQQAQYQIVPTMSDLQGFLNNETTRSIYGKVTVGNSDELMIDYISRCLTQATSDYKLLSGRTQYAIDPNTRIISLDLNDVMGTQTPSGRLQSAVMYLFAFHLTSGHFKLPQSQDELKSKVAEHYYQFHQKTINQLDEEMKTQMIDELHNAKGVPGIFETLNTQDREQRKFGIRTLFATQYLDDLPEAVLKSANSIYLMQASEDDRKTLQGFGIPNNIINKFIKLRRGPAPDGSGTTFLAVFNTKLGKIIHFLKNTLGDKELWAINSDMTDKKFRSFIYDALGGMDARDALSRYYVGGSAKKRIEYERRLAGDHESDNVLKRLSDEVIQKFFKDQERQP